MVGQGPQRPKLGVLQDVPSVGIKNGFQMKGFLSDFPAPQAHSTCSVYSSVTGLFPGLLQKSLVQSLLLHFLLLVGGKTGIVADLQGIENVFGLVKDLNAVLVDLVGQHLRLRQRHGDGLAGHIHLYLFQVHAGLDGAVIGDDKTLLGQGHLPAVKIHLVFKLAHIGVVILHRGQLRHGLQLLSDQVGGDDRLRAAAAEHRSGTEGHRQQHHQGQRPHQLPLQAEGFLFLFLFCLFHIGSLSTVSPGRGQ